MALPDLFGSIWVKNDATGLFVQNGDHLIMSASISATVSLVVGNAGESTPESFLVAGRISHNGQAMADKNLSAKVDGGLDEAEIRIWKRNVATTNIHKQRYDVTLFADVRDLIDEENAANNLAKFTFFMSVIG